MSIRTAVIIKSMEEMRFIKMQFLHVRNQFLNAAWIPANWVVRQPALLKFLINMFITAV